MYILCISGIFLLALIVLVIYLYLTWNFGYWKKRGVNGPEPKVLFGTFPSSINQKRNMIYDMEEIYTKYKKDEKFVGVFTLREPQLMILDPSLAHEVFVNKFKYFHNNSAALWVDKKLDVIIGNNPFFLTGEEWKEKRSEITPALTFNKIKACYPVMQEVCSKMTNYIKNLSLSSQKQCTINTKNLANRFTAEVVSDCIYGLEAGCFEETESQILKEAKIVVDNFVNGFFWLFISSVIPLASKIFQARFLSKKSETFFKKLLEDAIDFRLKSKIDRDDFLNYLLQLQEKKKLTMNEMTTHSMTFLGDGFETSATLISHTLLLLARNKTAQDQLRQEIQNNLDEDDTLGFDKLIEIPYLEQCIQESLRIFSPVLFLSKACTEPIEIENANGRKLKLDTGVDLHIPIHLFHHDEEYFPNPEEFIPERFSDENGGAKKYRDEGKFLPFGDGPRTCLGQKFGLVQSKASICEIIKNFEVTVNEKTRTDNLVSAQSMLTLLDGGIWLNYKEIKN